MISIYKHLKHVDKEEFFSIKYTSLDDILRNNTEPVPPIHSLRTASCYARLAEIQPLSTSDHLKFAFEILCSLKEKGEQKESWKKLFKSTFDSLLNIDELKDNSYQKALHWIYYADFFVELESNDTEQFAAYYNIAANLMKVKNYLKANNYADLALQHVTEEISSETMAELYSMKSLMYKSSKNSLHITYDYLITKLPSS